MGARISSWVRPSVRIPLIRSIRIAPPFWMLGWGKRILGADPLGSPLGALLLGALGQRNRARLQPGTEALLVARLENPGSPEE